MKNPHWYRTLVALALVLALSAWLAPYALSLYHLEVGGRALDAALVPISTDRLAPEQIVDAARLETGVAHLHQAIRWDPRNVQAMRLLVRVHLTQGHPGIALEVLRQALKVRPDNPLLYLELGDVYDSLGQAEAAIEAYETGGVGSRAVPLAVNCLKLADAHAQAGGGDVAIGLWRKAESVDAGNLYALYRLAQIHRAMGDEERAAGYEERLRYSDFNGVAVSPDSRMAGYQERAIVGLVDDGVWGRDKLINVISYQMWQLDEGAPGETTERILGTLLERRPRDTDILFYLAELYRRRGDLERAEATYQQVLESGEEYALAYLRLGMVSESASERGGEPVNQRLGEAAEWYERYHELAPDDLSGFKRLAAVCVALEDGGVEDESCRQGADRLGREDETRSPAAVLWAEWLEQAAAADPQYPAGQQLDNGWVFLGYDVDEERLVRGEMVDLLLYWAGPDSAVAGSEQDGWYRAGERWVQVLEDAQTLIPNGGFELGVEGESPAGFPEDIYDADPDTRRLATTTRGGRSTTAALLHNSTVDDNTSFASVYAPIEAERLYLQAGWIKGADGNGYLGRRWAGDVADAPHYSYVAAAVNPDDWQHYAGVTSPPQGADRCQLWLLNYKSVGQVYFDNVIFVEIGAPGE